MAETGEIELEFHEYESRIERLKKAEEELTALGTPEWREAHQKEIAIIEAQLKNPRKVDDVEKELDMLRESLKPPEDSGKPEKKPGAPPIEQSPPLYFPQELLSLYSSVESIGKGGFARIFRANRKKDGMPVAVKIPADVDPGVGKSFMKEIENWQKLEHENITQLLDCNILPAIYLEIELNDRSLEELPKPLALERAAFIILELSRGLSYAHNKGIIHRDLKPSNILLKNDVPKISDWGLSKVKNESRFTASMSLSPMYAAPEQYSQKTFGKVDERTDIFQLGVVFYELITGELPFKGDDIAGISYAITNEAPKPPSEINPEAADLDQIILKCLEKNKDDRYVSVSELQRDLAGFLGVDFKKSLNLSRNQLEKIKLCTDLIEVYASQNNGRKCLLYLKNLRGYISTTEFQNIVKEEIKALEFYLEKDMSLADRLPTIEEIVHRSRMGE